MEGNEINTFNSAKECAEKLGTSIHFANEAINAGKCIKGTFLTKDPNKVFDLIKTYMDSKIINDKSISIYDSESGLLIKTFSSMNDVSKFLKISYKEIKNCICNSIVFDKYLISYGFSNEYKKSTNPGLKINQYDLDGNFIKT